MASKCINLVDNLLCPVCYNVFRDPVVLSCSHSVCNECLQSFWANSEFQNCPLCRRRSSKPEPTSNLVLKNVCESFLQQCCQHSEQLTHFCVEDKQPLCVVCKALEEHKNHDCRPIHETAEGYKRELETTLRPLQEKLHAYLQAERTYLETTEHIKLQTQKTERQVRKEFDRLHQFLYDEEVARMAALREEEEQKSQLMKEKAEEISRAISFLSETIKSIEEDLKTEDILFLQNFASSQKRAQCSLKDPQMDSVVLLDVAKHLGNLNFRVWEKMQDIVHYTPVILDPNTAHSHLTLSDDLSSVTFTGNGKPEMQQLPDNPERFDKCACVLGSEGFSSGSHWWDIGVGDSSLWEVGITTESNQRKGGGGLFYDGVWSVESNVEYYTRSPSQPQSLFSAEGGLPYIRIQLDWDRGQVSFIDLLNDTVIATFSHTFTEKVYPFFWTRRSRSPVKILPVMPVISLPGPDDSAGLYISDYIKAFQLRKAPGPSNYAEQ